MSDRHTAANNRKRKLALRSTFGHAEKLRPYSDEMADVLAIWCYALMRSDYEPSGDFARLTSIRPVNMLPGSDNSTRYYEIARDVEEFLLLGDAGGLADEIVRCGGEAGVDYMLGSYYSGVPLDMILV